MVDDQNVDVLFTELGAAARDAELGVT